MSIWDGANVLAQALQHIERENSALVAAELRSRLRVYPISDQDDSGAYIRRRWGGRYTRITESEDIQEYGTSRPVTALLG